jgi:predicted GTPase
MPYGDLEAMRVQRFATLADIDASHPTVEEREEYEAPVELGMVVYAGVDYADVLGQAQQEADVIVWDGGNNDFPFYEPDLLITVTDPLRAGHELGYHPGETNLRMADVVVVNKVDSAAPEDVERVLAGIAAVNPRAKVIRAESPVTLDAGSPLTGRRVLVVEDGPTLTHGGMTFGAGVVAARRFGAAALVDPRPVAVGSIRAVLERYPDLEPLVPAMGYGETQMRELKETLERADADLVLAATPIDLSALLQLDKPVTRVRYELVQVEGRPLAEILAEVIGDAGRAG